MCTITTQTVGHLQPPFTVCTLRLSNCVLHICHRTTAGYKTEFSCNHQTLEPGGILHMTKQTQTQKKSRSCKRQHQGLTWHLQVVAHFIMISCCVYLCNVDLGQISNVLWMTFQNVSVLCVCSHNAFFHGVTLWEQHPCEINIWLSQV